MIDRKVLRIFVLLLFVMTAGAVWRLSLLPDWRLPAGGPGSQNTVSGLLLFAAPASLLLVMVTPFIQWLAAPKETLPSWRRWSGKWIVSWSVFWALMQAFVLARSLGLVSLSNLDRARVGLVMIGIIFLIVGNFAPKAPSLPQCNSSQLDRWRVSRMFRFAGKLFVGLGLAFVLGGVLLPLEYWEPVFLCLMLAALTAGMWYSIKLRHERSLAMAPGRSSQANI
ncbi:MAG TPA: hypothetical protein VGG49_04855 [Steroidobacteraceae bacterium]|jgi:hypothetical protein